jgi:hypothetical protein
MEFLDNVLKDEGIKNFEFLFSCPPQKNLKITPCPPISRRMTMMAIFFCGEFSQTIDINFEKRTFFGKLYSKNNCLFHKIKNN